MHQSADSSGEAFRLALLAAIVIGAATALLGEPASWFLSLSGWAATWQAMPLDIVLVALGWSGEDAENWHGLQERAAVSAISLYAPPMLFSAFRAARNRPDLAHRQRHDLASLTGVQSRSWRHLKAILPLADTPEGSAESRSFEAWLDHRVGGVEPSLEAVNDALAADIGPIWNGPDALPASLRALIASFVLFHDDDRTAGDDMLAALARAAARRRGATIDREVERLRATIDDILASPAGLRLLAIADRHFWQRPACMAMLAAARDGRGVLASASFVWLARVDRLMWVALNSLGSPAAPIEAAAARAHFAAERQLGMPLAIPATHHLATSIMDQWVTQSAARRR